MLKVCDKHGMWEPPPKRCPECRPPNASWSPDRDNLEHKNWANALKRAHPYCQRCGSTLELHAHHTHGISDPRGIVLCRTHHREEDKYAR